VESRRAESFSDGVFAVAITVLVFNLLPIADQTAHSLTVTGHDGHPGLVHYWPAYLAYVISFLIIGIMWLNHHVVFAQVTSVNRTLLVLNLILLMGIVALPFPTALVADHLTGSGGHGQATVAVVTYGLLMIAISISFGGTWVYISRHLDELAGRRPVRPSRMATLRFVAGNAGYVAGTVIALASPVAALIIFALLAIYYLFEHLPQPARDGQIASSTDEE
jgi:TMEM175 potassium channel family protein